MEAKQVIILNRNQVIVDWTSSPLRVTVGVPVSVQDKLGNTNEIMVGAEFSEDDIHTILRCINEVRRIRQGELVCQQ